MIVSTILGIGLLISLIVYRSKVKKIIVIVRYEIIYWVLGSVVMLEDFIFAYKNVLKDLPRRDNDVAVITGASRGIGLEVVKKLLQCNMHVIIGCRNGAACNDAIAAIREGGLTLGTVECEELDTSSIRSVENFAAKILSKVNKLHLLINNAGIMAVPYALTEDGFESQLAVNYLGHALLTYRLLPLLKETGKNSSEYTRIVHVSSCAHIPGSINFNDINYTKDIYVASASYAQSKLAQLMFSNALDRKLRQEEAKVVSIAVHPGVVNTELFDGTPLKIIAPWAPKLLFKTPEKGARTVVFAALSKSLEGRGGLYLSNCREAWTSKTARDIHQQDRLMNLTLEMLHLKGTGSSE